MSPLAAIFNPTYIAFMGFGETDGQPSYFLSEGRVITIVEETTSPCNKACKNIFAIAHNGLDPWLNNFGPYLLTGCKNNIGYFGGTVDDPFLDPAQQISQAVTIF